MTAESVQGRRDTILAAAGNALDAARARRVRCVPLQLCLQ